MKRHPFREFYLTFVISLSWQIIGFHIKKTLLGEWFPHLLFLSADSVIVKRRAGQSSWHAAVHPATVVPDYLRAWQLIRSHFRVPAPGNECIRHSSEILVGGRPVLSAHLNVETAGSERKRPEI